MQSLLGQNKYNIISIISEFKADVNKFDEKPLSMLYFKESKMAMAVYLAEKKLS